MLEAAAQERADELAKANEALRRSLSSLTTAKELSTFLQVVLQEVVSVTDAASAVVFVHNVVNNTLHATDAILKGEVIDVVTDPRFEIMRIVPADVSDLWRQMSENGKTYWFDNDAPPPEEWTFANEWHRQMGHRTLATIPLKVGTQVLGYLGLAFVDVQQPTEIKLEQANALAQQIALAMQISRLSEEAKQVAIAREREQAAQERVAELTSVNAALQRSLTTLTTADSLQSFLQSVLQQTIYTTGAVSGAVFIYNSSSHTLIPSEMILRGEVLDVQTDPRLEVWRAAPGFSLNFWAEMVQKRRIFWHDLQNSPFEIADAVQLWHKQMGHKALAWVPMFLQQEALGFLGLAFAEVIQPTENKLEQCQVLAQHTALALQISRLSQGAKQAAIAREQEKAAQERAEELAAVNAALTQRDRLLAVIAQITQELLENSDVEQAIAEAMKTLGQAVGASRVIILQEKPEADTGQLQNHVWMEWTVASIPRQLDQPGHHVVNHEDNQATIDNLHTGRSLRLYLEDYPDPIQPYMANLQIKASGIAPIFVGETYFGCICFDNCVDRRLWSDQEMEVLTTGAKAIGAALLRQRLVDRAIQTQAERERAAELARSNEVLTQRDRLLSVVAQITQELLENPNTEEAIFQAMGKLGQASGASRMNVLQERLEAETGRLQHYVNLEWTIPNVPRQIDDPDTKVVNNDDFTEIFADLHAGRAVCLYLEEYPAPVQPYLARIAIQVSGIAPIFMGSEYFGCLCLDNCTDRRLWSDQEMEVLATGASAIGAALLRQKLADQLMQARAEEERADELAKANAAMSRILTLTARETGIDALLRSVLAALSEQFDTPLAEWWEEIDATTVAKRLSYLNGRLLSAQEMQGHHGVPYFKLPTEMGTLDELLREPYLCEDLELLPWDEVEMEKLRAWYGAQGLSKFFNVRVNVDSRGIGYLLVFLPADRAFTETQIQFASGMAQHLALAIMIAKRAEAAQEAAVAREQEQAAQERAAQLEQTNQSLQRTISYLNENPSLQAFLHAVLQEALTVSGAVTSTVFTYDAASHTLQNIACVLHGEVVDIATDPRLEIWRAPVPADITPAWRTICHEVMWFNNDDAPSPEHWPISIPWHRQFGHKTIVCMLLSAGEEPLGFLGLAFAAAVPPEETKFAQCRTLAQQVSLALRLENLSQQATQSALLKEQERAAQERAAQLEQTNQSLQRTIGYLNENPSLQAFLNAVLRETMIISGAVTSGVIAYDAASHTLQGIAAIVHDAVVDIGTDPNMEFWRTPIPADVSPIWKPLCQQEILWADIDDPDPEIRSLATPWHKQMGHKMVICLLLSVGDQPLGLLGLAFATAVSLEETKLAQCRTLAQQVSLALRLENLSQQATQSALLKEQERAAQERAAQLEQTNQSLQRTISYLNENPSLQAFLHAVLQEALTVSGAVTSAVFAYDAPSHTLQNIACVLQGEVVDIATDPRMEIWRVPVPADITPAWRTICHEALWLDNDFPPPEHWPISIPWHRQFGHKTIVCMPLSAGEEPLGFLGLAFAAAVPPEETKFAQCRTLAQQVSLALRLENLSQQATQSALLEERNRMAGEIHDTLAQSFTGINFQINLAKRIAQAHPEAVAEIYDRIAQLAQNGLAEARRSVWSLYSANEAYESLEQDLHHCVERIMGTSPDVRVEIKTAGVAYQLPETIGKNLLRIGQEAITNIFKHAQATLIEVEIRYQEDQIGLLVKDNGHGFLLQENYKGFGLVGMTERAERMNGQLTITTEPDVGTQILIQVPLPS